MCVIPLFVGLEQQLEENVFLGEVGQDEMGAGLDEAGAFFLV